MLVGLELGQCVPLDRKGKIVLGQSISHDILYTIYLGKTSTSTCPVSATLQYLAIRPKGDGPMFVSSSGKPITTKRIFVSRVRETLARAGVDASSYKGHSFCIGAATTAAACGKALGRWSSCSYQVYIKIPPQELASIPPILTQQAI